MNAVIRPEDQFMKQTTRLIVEQGLPKFFTDGIKTTPFDAEKIFQDFYMLGRETREFKGKDASDLTDKALAILVSHKQQETITRNDVHQVIQDLLYMSGYSQAAGYVKNRMN
jgi:hypothetical protein